MKTKMFVCLQLPIQHSLSSRLLETLLTFADVATVLTLQLMHKANAPKAVQALAHQKRSRHLMIAVTHAVTKFLYNSGPAAVSRVLGIAPMTPF
jgi:hypothetical protein